jgi:S1-C subfamily serine protease
MVQVTTRDPNAAIASASAFHIGDGWLLTARHVVEDREIVELTPERHGHIGPLEAGRVLFHPDEPDVDLALIETNYSAEFYLSDRYTIVGTPREWKTDHIQIGHHLDDWIGDELVMTRVLVMGYPPIPLAGASLVAASGRVLAVIDRYIGPGHPFFVVSPLPRGGFSGGPVLSEYGFLLGVMTDSLVGIDLPAELGYAAALSVEPIWTLLDAYDLKPGRNTWGGES